ncbi:hypothetical protein [Natrialba taiwanensis]|uniref:Uncharacterized protein n=1 Tax=Natrialba taiwanensis DSM 12281 TaxID=1230458 RepID=L9ZH86_9EURY|nr:hypothetical protein [Natrialba taiwanensis]ELY85724.1 hypothetical protein C484_20447 [Natrialba taiwanensis DSM 12281]
MTDESADETVPEPDAGEDGAERDEDVEPDEFSPDPERVERIRAVADDVRGESSESKQLANILYRTSDLYDADEDTSPEEIVRNVKFILEVNERGGLGR